ncbi:MAG: hypothetical protein RQ733_00560 [Methyloprofundus sp.]|nr:hypothetical protein [Methyloprofundus sp.]MDT8424445.1 hypothetical protein [Methyloprofundus sp.]
MIKRVVCLMILLLAACQSVSEKPKNLTYCPEVRSPVCTRIYKPVCGQDKAEHIKTYPSDCTACANSDVIGYREGACAGEIK